MAEKRARTRGGKDIRHVVRVTAAEERILTAKADAVGVTVARFLADSALGTVPVVRPRVAVNELFAIRRQLLGKQHSDELMKTLALLDQWLSDN